MLSESHPLIRRILRFAALPYCYVKLVNWKECTKSKYQVAKDLLYIFFWLKYYPDNYSPCRFWEKSRDEWIYYYGSSYNSYPRMKLRKLVQPFEHQIIFNDKNVCELLCKGMDVRIPTSFGVIDPTDDCRKEIETIFNNTDLTKLIIKPILGHAGLGIILAIKKPNNQIVIQTKTSEYDLEKFVFKDKAIIQEVVVQSDELAKISDKSINTIRVVSLLCKSKEVLILSASMRFGVGNAFVDNWSAGGVAVGVNHQNGTLMEVAYDKRGNKFYEHPDSKIVFKDFKIPRWNEVLEIAKTVQKSCTFYKLIGIDVAVTNTGPILIEINANSDIIFQEQTAGPLLKDKKILTEFAKYDLLINKYQKRLLSVP